MKIVSEMQAHEVRVDYPDAASFARDLPRWIQHGYGVHMYGTYIPERNAGQHLEVSYSRHWRTHLNAPLPFKEPEQ